MNRTNVGRQMVGDLGNFVGRDLSSQFMSKPQRLAEGDVVEEAEEVELEEVTYTRADGSTVTYQYNPLTHEKPGMDGRMLKKGIDYDAVATQGGLGEFYEQATVVEAPAAAAAAAAGPARSQQRRRLDPINPETSSDAEEREQERDQLFNPLQHSYADPKRALTDYKLSKHVDLPVRILSKGLIDPDPDRALRDYMGKRPDSYVRSYVGRPEDYGKLVLDPRDQTLGLGKATDLQTGKEIDIVDRELAGMRKLHGLGEKDRFSDQQVKDLFAAGEANVFHLQKPDVAGPEEEQKSFLAQASVKDQFPDQPDPEGTRRGTQGISDPSQRHEVGPLWPDEPVGKPRYGKELHEVPPSSTSDTAGLSTLSAAKPSVTAAQTISKPPFVSRQPTIPIKNQVQNMLNKIEEEDEAAVTDGSRREVAPPMLPPPPDDPGFGTGVTGTGPSQSLIEADIREAQRESEREDAPPTPRWGTESHTAPAPIRSDPRSQISPEARAVITNVAEELISRVPKRVDPTLPGPLSLTREDKIAREADRRERPGPFTGWGTTQLEGWDKLVGDAQQGIRSLVSPVSKALQSRLLALAQDRSEDPINIDPPYGGSGGVDITDPYHTGRGHYEQYDPRIYEDEIGITTQETPTFRPGKIDKIADVYRATEDLAEGGIDMAHLTAQDQISFAQEIADADEDNYGYMMNRGGPVRFAQGGGLESVADQYLQPGSYVLSADVMSGLGDGSSEAGFERLSGLLGIPMPGTETSVNAYSGGPMLGKIEGPGTGTSDSVHTIIQSSDGKSGQQAARVAREEGVLTPEALKEMDRRFGTGKGDLGNAHNMMNNMMANVRKVKSGGRQPKDIIGQRQDPLKGLMGLFQKA